MLRNSQALTPNVRSCRSYSPNVIQWEWDVRHQLLPTEANTFCQLPSLSSRPCVMQTVSTQAVCWIGFGVDPFIPHPDIVFKHQEVRDSCNNTNIFLSRATSYKTAARSFIVNEPNYIASSKQLWFPDDSLRYSNGPTCPNLRLPGY